MSSDRVYPYVYAVLRLVPRPELGECVNVGVVLFSRPARFLSLLAALNEQRARALWPELDLVLVKEYLAGMELVANGDALGGPVAALDLSERFHWLSSVSNTIIQPGLTHTGLTTDPGATLNRLFRELVPRE